MSSLEQKAEILADKIQQAGLRLATAESCTGGWISQVLTSVPGSSDWFEGAIVSYSNNMKHNLLDVPEETLHAYGAVSQPVIEKMALGVIKKLETPLSIAVSGIAGPGGGTASKPVGTVWIAWCFDNQVQSRCYLFDGYREAVRRQTVEVALDGMIQMIETIPL